MSFIIHFSYLCGTGVGLVRILRIWTRYLEVAPPEAEIKAYRQPGLRPRAPISYEEGHFGRAGQVLAVLCVGEEWHLQFGQIWVVCGLTVVGGRWTGINSADHLLQT